SGSGTLVQGNYIGTDITGTVGLGNGTHPGISVEGPNTTIGGTTAGARNLISGGLVNGFGYSAVSIGAANCVVQGNYIGTDITGTVALPNYSGIDARFGATIGGTAPGAGNLISG